MGRDDGPSRAADASGRSAARPALFYFAWGCFRYFVSRPTHRRRLFTCPRFRPRLRQVQAGPFPAIRSFGVPRHIGIAVCQDSLCRIPGHPAIGQAVNHHQRGSVARRRTDEPAPQIVFRRGRELSVAGVRQPHAAGNVKPRLVTPDCALGKIWRLRRARHYIDEHPRLGSPDRAGFCGRQNTHAGKGCGNRRTVVFHAVPVGLGRFLLR